MAKKRSDGHMTAKAKRASTEVRVENVRGSSPMLRVRVHIVVTLLCPKESGLL